MTAAVVIEAAWAAPESRSVLLTSRESPCEAMLVAEGMPPPGVAPRSSNLGVVPSLFFGRHPLCRWPLAVGCVLVG